MPGRKQPAPELKPFKFPGGCGVQVSAMYITDLRDEDIELSVKVVIVGNGAVGKSSMIQVSLRSNVDFGSLNSFKCDIKVPKSWKDCCLQILTF